MPSLIMRVMVGGEEKYWWMFGGSGAKMLSGARIFPLLIVERQDTAVTAVDALIRQGHRLHPLRLMKSN